MACIDFISGGEHYINLLLDSAPQMRGRTVTVLDSRTESPIPARIIVSQFDSRYIYYSLQNTKTKEEYGFMSVMPRCGEAVYVGRLKNKQRETVRGVGTHLLDQAFLLGCAHADHEGKPGLRLASSEDDRQPDPAPFYLKYGFRPIDDAWPKYRDILQITRNLRKLRKTADDPKHIEDPSVIRAKEILSKELGQESISNEELFEKWYWDTDTQPSVSLTRRIMALSRQGKSASLVIEMPLPDESINAIRERILKFVS